MSNATHPKIYQSGNFFQKKKYKYLSEYNFGRGINIFGKSKDQKGKQGEYYAHLLDIKDKAQNFLTPDILIEVEKRFQSKAGDLPRVLTNTAASQACCFNLFVPLKNNLELANKLFSSLMGKLISIDEIIIEFTPNKSESIGDQGKFQGTDADVGIFYKYDTNKKGVLLLEFKYIEAEFSYCSSYKSKSKRKHIKELCDSQEYYAKLITPNIKSNNKSPLCGYLKYDNWQLTESSTAFNPEAIKQNNCCPFRFSLQQLWRNMLLAENVCRARGLDEFNFWVISPYENEHLWNNANENVEDNFRSILSDIGNNSFKRIALENDIIRFIEKHELTKELLEWLNNFKKRYIE